MRPGTRELDVGHFLMAMGIGAGIGPGMVPSGSPPVEVLVHSDANVIDSACNVGGACSGASAGAYTSTTTPSSSKWATAGGGREKRELRAV
eukprot:gene15541-biopygen18721